jgi:hypothetical protein
MPGVTELRVKLSDQGEQPVYLHPTWATRPNGVVLIIYYKYPDQLTPVDMARFNRDLARLSDHICHKAAPLWGYNLRNIGRDHFTPMDVAKIEKFITDLQRFFQREL